MRKMLITAAALAGLMMIVGQVEEPTGWKGILTEHDGLMTQVLFQPASARAQGPGKAPTYAEVDAIIAKYHCTVCHGGNEPRSGLNLESYALLRKGGKSGQVVIPGAAEKSELVRRLKGLNEPRMPSTGPPWLTDDEVAAIEAWITAGAKQGQ